MKYAVLFPGQGSQKIGMGLDLYKQVPISKNIFNTTNNILGKKLSDLIFYGPTEELNQTINTQPAIVTVSILLTLILKEELHNKNLSFKPSACCGHSLGEFTALWFLGGLSIEKLIKLVSKRASLMQNAPPGGMAAILNLTFEEIENLINKDPEFKNKVVIANHNAPNQFVISGEKPAIEKLTEKIKSQGNKAIILPVSGAFHSSLMEEPSKAFSFEVEKLFLLSEKNTIIPIYQNCDGKPTADYIQIKEKIKKQMTSPVFWTQTINNLVNDDITTLIEIGPGKVLTGLAKKINPKVDCYNISDLLSLNEFINSYEHKFLSAKP